MTTRKQEEFEASASSESLLSRAYSLSSPEDAKDLYRDWAQTYDHHLEAGLHYQGPEKIADMLASVLDEKSARVIDIGCGTGLVGQYLSSRGFSKIDGLDFSPEMLAVARSKSIYQELLEADLEKTLKIDPGSYQGAICCGTFTHGHVGPSALRQIFPILQDHAPFACTIHAHLWYEAGFERTLLELETDGVMTIEEIRDEAYFEDKAAEGKFCIFRKNPQ